MTYRDYINRLYGLTRGHRMRLWLRIVAGILRVAVLLTFVIACKRLVDIATGSAAGSIVWWSVGMCCCMVLQIGLGIAVSRLSLSTETRIANSLRSDIFNRALAMPYTQGRHSADIMERAKKDADTLATLAGSSLPAAIVTSVQLGGAFALLAYFDWRLALIMVAIMPFTLAVGKIFLRRMRHLTHHLRSADTAVHTHLQEHMRLRSIDRAFHSGPAASSRLDRLQQRVYRLIMRRNNYSLWSRSMIQAGFAAGYATAFLWGIAGLWSGAVTFGVMTAFLQLVAQVQRPAVELSQQIPAFVYGITSAERIDELPKRQEHESTGPLHHSGPLGLRLTDISFAYPDAPHIAVLSGVSHRFRPSTLTAVTGATGAGKTTLFRLLLGWIVPLGGSIEIEKPDGSSASLQEGMQIAIVPQGNTLFSATIRENLRIANPGASDAEMRKALHEAAADFTDSLPAGIDTRLGEGGARLSEGQAQRIAIARALLHQSPILLLDEPTSALDPATESRLMKSLQKISATRGTTIIVITHRQETAAFCSDTLSL